MITHITVLIFSVFAFLAVSLTGTVTSRAQQPTDSAAEAVAAAAPALEIPVLITSPLPKYDYDKLEFALNNGVERAPGGRLWATWVSGEDGPGAYCMANFSDDNGKTWSKPALVIDPHSPELAFPRSSLGGNFWLDPKGRLWLFFDQSMMEFDGRCGVWATICENPDDAKPVWSTPRRLWDGFLLNKPTVLANGDWLLPVSIWSRPKISPFKEGFRELDPYRMANVLVSTDQGKTWTRRGGVSFPNRQFDEHMFIERKDGSLWMTARTSKGTYESVSTDGGHTWTAPQPCTSFKQTTSRHFIRRLKSGNILLVKNGIQIQEAPGRICLTAFLSEDDGVTWKGGLLLDGGTSVTYPDGTQGPDGTIYITYDNDRAGKGEILMARFTEEDILAGKFINAKSEQRILVSRALGITAAVRAEAIEKARIKAEAKKKATATAEPDQG